MMCLPSGWNATKVIEPVCPAKRMPIALSESSSQILTVESREPETMRVLSGKNAMEATELVWPSNSFPVSSPVAES